MMVFLYIIIAILGISSIVTFLIVFLINKSSNKDDYDEVQFAKTKKFDPNEFEDDESFDEDVEIIITIDVMLLIIDEVDDEVELAILINDEIDVNE